MLKSAWTRWSIVLGIALGGFFDGILLHQVLQWHHLLSLVPGSGDLRRQVLWDGSFHVLMYLIAAVGLWGLWRTWKRNTPGSARDLPVGLLLGFGIWNVVDVVLFHWILGIHRIRLETDNPLFWDVLWLAVFGIAPLLAALAAMRPRKPRSGGPGTAMAAMLLAALVSGAGLWALRPPPGSDMTTVVFAPGVSPEEAVLAVARADGRLVTSDAGMSVVIAEIPANRRWELYRSRALLVTGVGPVAGCAAWLRA